jgi:hypothetical protein
VAEAAAAEVVGEDDRPRRLAPQAVRAGARRMDPGDAAQLAWLTTTIEAHVTGLPRAYGDVRRLVVYDGDEPIYESEGAGGSAHELAQFLIMRATLEGKRIAIYIAPQCADHAGKVRQVCRWRFFARPEQLESQADPERSAGAWNGESALRLRDAHNHQLVQALITQNSQHATAIQAVLEGQAKVMREVAETSASILKGIARVTESLSGRAESAEKRAHVAAEDSRDYQRALLDAHKAMADAASELEITRKELDAGPVNAAVKEFTRVASERVLERVGLGPGEAAAKSAAVAEEAAKHVNGVEVQPS